MFLRNLSVHFWFVLQLRNGGETEVTSKSEEDEKCTTEDREDAIEQQRGLMPVEVPRSPPSPPPAPPLPEVLKQSCKPTRMEPREPNPKASRPYCRPTMGGGPTSVAHPFVAIDTIDGSCAPERMELTVTVPSTTESTDEEVIDNSVNSWRHCIKYLFKRCWGLKDIPQVLVFGIILYLVDVGSDIWAAVDHFQEGNPPWGSLTITFVILPALCWAAISWTWWFCYDPREDEQDGGDRNARYRRWRLLLSVLLLDPLVRYL